ncbi:hypothetical protein TNCV_1732521 [Trichonephila clavipes]|nr:hypothetical protein TNCV_1732521 [Trichonephila clavipes]
MACIPLTARHRTTRRKWAPEQRNMMQSDQSKLLFKDESQFSLEHDTRRALDNPKFLIPRLVENCLEAKSIQRMEWPACYPDLNPIELVWNTLG